MRLLILQDSPDFGGHEKIFLSFFPALLETSDIAAIRFVFPARNLRLAAELRAIKSLKLDLLPSPFTKNRGEPYLAPLRFSYRHFVRQEAAAFLPDRILLLQGRIENLLVPLLGLPTEKIISYLPMAHSMLEMNKRDCIGDYIRRFYYQRPSRFIVPSAAVAGQLRRAGVTNDVRIVRNVVTPPARTNKQEARTLLGLPMDKTVFMFMGRFDSHQKGIDNLLIALKAAKHDLQGSIVLFVGSGPGKTLIHTQAAAMTSLDIRIIDWTDQPNLILSATDILLCPSRFEGVPLVLLEAMTYGIPVIGSRIDVYKEYLPEMNLLDFEKNDLAKVVQNVLTEQGRRIFADYSAQIIGGFNIENSRQAFLAGLIDAL